MLSSRQVQEDGADDVPWLTAYADLISAVLAVVVLMLTFAPVNLHELKDAVAKDAPAEPQSQKTASLQELRERILEAASAHGVQQHVALVYDHRGLEVSIDSVALFETGSAVLDVRAVERLMPVFSVISEASNERYVDINGHTDDTGSDDLNWRLSSERALAMLQFLRQYNLSTRGARLIAFANTEPRIDPKGLSGERLDEARKANRRISLLIHRRLGTVATAFESPGSLSSEEKF